MKLKGKNVLVVGLGKSGEAAAKFFHNEGAKVKVTDEKTKHELAETLRRLDSFKFEYDLGRFNTEVFTTADLIFLSPGVSRKLPEVQAAIQANVPMTNDIELVREYIKVPLIVVTGTNGKTTTTSMIAQMLATDGKKVFTCGNIGTPALDFVNNKVEADAVVMEISSFQAETLNAFKPDVVVLTNLEPNHLDRHGTLEEYFNAKKKLISQLDEKCTLVLNLDNAPSQAWAQETRAKVLYFTRKDPMTLGIAEKFNGSYLKRPKIINKINGVEQSFDLMGSKLPGDHNKENFMAAANAALSVGCSAQAIQRTILEFKGVEHRLEFTRRKDGVSIYNDSKATTAAAVARSLLSFNMPIILIAGGRDKDEDFTVLCDLVKKKVKNLILLGESKEKLNRAIGDFSETFLVGTFEEAVLIAYQKSRNGDIVLFSPGCTSYDMFKNYEERGAYFKKLVAQL